MEGSIGVNEFREQDANDDQFLNLADSLIQEGKKDLTKPQGVGKVVLGETIRALKTALTGSKTIDFEGFVETLKSDLGNSVEFPTYIPEEISISPDLETSLKKDPSCVKALSDPFLLPQGLKKVAFDSFDGVFPALMEYRQRVKEIRSK
ncbi:hypothetical protein M1307_03825 [Patescibacteria group bacterium]|nr:hypothetical protein [Patescibacteria group bacterium]